jgi:hypothetical protein
VKVDNQEVKTVTTLEDLKVNVSKTMTELIQLVNGKISFSDNFDGRIASAAFTSMGVDTQVVHGLNRIPVGYIVCKANAPLSVYDGSRASDNNNIYLRSSAVGTANILVF